MRRIVSCLVLLSPFGFGSSAHAQSTLGAEITYELPKGKTAATVPFDFELNKVVFGVRIHGGAPIRVVLDTGMPVDGIILYRSKAVDALGLAESAMKIRVGGVGGKGEAQEATLTAGLDVEIGDLKLTGVPAIVMDRPKGFGHSDDGIIGATLFSRLAVRVAFDDGRIELMESKEVKPEAGATIIPLRKDHGHSFAKIGVAVGSGAESQVLPAEVVVDLGAGHALSLNLRDENRIPMPEASIESTLGRGVSGVIQGRVGRIGRLVLGDLVLPNVVTSFPNKEHQDAPSANFVDGNLGAGVLSRFCVTFDLKASRMILVKSKRFDDPFETDMSGLQFDRDDDDGFVVRDVVARSPAAEQGIAVGDRLISIDGKLASELRADGVRNALQGDGREVRLEISHDGSKVEKTLKLRRLV